MIISAQTVFVPVRHWVYDFLDRMETKRHLPIVLSGTKPMTRSEVSGYLQQLEKNRDKLSNTEIEQLDYLLFEFQNQRSQKEKSREYKTRLKKITEQARIKSWLPEFVYPTGRHLLEIEHGPVRLNFDPLFYRSRIIADDDTLASQDRINTDTNGFLIWGTVGPWVGFYTDVRDTREWGTRRYPAGNTTVKGYGFVQGNGEQIYHDETIAYLLFQKNYFSLQFGKDSNVWGPAAHGQMFLSNNATSYDQFKIQLNLPRLKYTYVLAWLKHYTPDYFKGEPTTKFFAAHRLEFSPHNRIDIGLQSGVVYSERFEPAYLNPVMFFRSAEHYLGDTDNAVMGLDVELKPVRNFKLYGELFLDDLTTSKLGTGFYGNKYGYMLGGFYAGLFGVNDLDLRVEYSKMRPFVYSHKDTATSYAHFNTALGHWMGANSDNAIATLRYQLSRRLRIEAAARRYRFGSNTKDNNVGRGLFRPRDFISDAEYIAFLDGDLHEINKVSLSASYEFVRNGFLQIAYSYVGTKSDKASEWDYPVSRSQLDFGFSLNY
jgi:hypothetical protein